MFRLIGHYLRLCAIFSVLIQNYWIARDILKFTDKALKLKHPDRLYQFKVYKKRLYFYAVFSFFTDLFISLSHYHFTKRDKIDFILIHFCTPIIDDLCDDYGFTEAQINDLIFKNIYPEMEIIPIQVIIAQILYPKINELLINNPSLIPQIESVIYWQFESIKPKELSLAYAKGVTFNKSALSMLMFWDVLIPQKLKGNEKQLFSQCAFLIQFTDDVVDAEKDLLTDSFTIVTQSENPDQLINFYNAEISQLKDYLNAIDWRLKDKKYFLFCIHLLVAHAQMRFDALENNIHQPLKEAILAKKMSPDLAKLKNIWIYYKTFIRLNKLT